MPEVVSELSYEECSKIANGVDAIQLPMGQYPPACPSALGLEPVVGGSGTSTEQVWVVRVLQNKVPYVLDLPCTMTVYRGEEGSLTLINAVRVEDELEDKILKLGPVKNIVKLGQFHGIANGYYLHNPKFGKPKLWTFAGGTVAPGSKADEILSPTNVPIPNATLYQLTDLKLPEGALLIPTAEGTVCVYCDVLFHLPKPEGGPWLGRLIMRLMGFLCDEGLPFPPPVWLSLTSKMAPKSTVLTWYQDLFALEFSHCIGAHGAPILNFDRTAVQEIVSSKLASLK